MWALNLTFNGHGRDERLAKWGFASVSWSCAVTLWGETPMLFSQLFSFAVLNKDLREGLDFCLNRFLACHLIESVISLALEIPEVWKDETRVWTSSEMNVSAQVFNGFVKSTTPPIHLNSNYYFKSCIHVRFWDCLLISNCYPNFSCLTESRGGLKSS